MQSLRGSNGSRTDAFCSIESGRICLRNKIVDIEGVLCMKEYREMPMKKENEL